METGIQSRLTRSIKYVDSMGWNCRKWNSGWNTLIDEEIIDCGPFGYDFNHPDNVLENYYDSLNI